MQRTIFTECDEFSLRFYEQSKMIFHFKNYKDNFHCHSLASRQNGDQTNKELDRRFDVIKQSSRAWMVVWYQKMVKCNPKKKVIFFYKR